MAVFHIILRHLPIVVCSLLAQKINGVCLLQQRVPFIFLIGQHFPDAAFIPLCLAVPVRYAVPFEVLGNSIGPFAVKELLIYPSDYFRLFFIDNEIAVFIFVIA
jgi:hypothetical protein